MNKQNYNLTTIERKLRSAEIAESVFTTLLLDRMVQTLDHGAYTKKELNHWIKRLNSVRKQVAILKNKMYSTKNWNFETTPEKTMLIENPTECDRLNEMFFEIENSMVNMDIPF